jgi:hypothetical protein
MLVSEKALHKSPLPFASASKRLSNRLLANFRSAALEVEYRSAPIAATSLAGGDINSVLGKLRIGREAETQYDVAKTAKADDEFK